MIKTKTSRRESLRFSNFGFSTILLSFVMICVVCFSALSLLSAYSDYKLSKKVATKTTQYYSAKERAFERLEELDKFLCNAYLSSSVEDAYFEIVSQDLDTCEAFNNEALEMQYDAVTSHVLSFKEPIADGQYLLVDISICFPGELTDTFYRILTWRSVYDTQVPEEEYLNLIE